MMKLIHSIAGVVLLLSLVIGCGSEPQTFEEYMKAGRTALAKSDYATARDMFGEALEIKPSHRDALVFMGLSYQRDMQVDSAFFYLRRADILYPNSRDINLELIELARALGEWKVAASAMRVLIATGDSERQWIPHLVDAYSRLNEGLATRYWGRKQLAYDTTNPELYLRVATALVMMDSVQEGIALIDTAVERFGEKPELLSNRATFLAYAGNYEKAEQAFRSLLAKDSTNQSLLINLANTLASQASKAKKREALQIYRSVDLPTRDERSLDSLIQSLQNEIDQM